MATATKRRTESGQFSACGHQINWCYEVPKGFRMTDEVRERLQDAAEERSRDCIAEDCVEGELCTYWVHADRINDTEFRGWWSIARD